MFRKICKEDSVLLSKAGLSTQETLINDRQETADIHYQNLTQTEELLKTVGLGSLIKPTKPCHQRTGTDISDLAQFENVDEDIEDEGTISHNIFSHNNRIIKKSPLPTVVDHEYGDILKVRK